MQILMPTGNFADRVHELSIGRVHKEITGGAQTEGSPNEGCVVMLGEYENPRVRHSPSELREHVQTVAADRSDVKKQHAGRMSTHLQDGLANARGLTYRFEA